MHQKLQEPKVLDRRLHQWGRAAVWAMEFIGYADPRDPELVVPPVIRIRNNRPRRVNQPELGIVPEVDVKRLGSKDPVGVVLEFRAAADRPANLRSIVAVRK